VPAEVRIVEWRIPRDRTARMTATSRCRSTSPRGCRRGCWSRTRTALASRSTRVPRRPRREDAEHGAHGCDGRAGAGPGPSVFEAGDEATAKGLLREFGWAEPAILDLGGIRAARATEMSEAGQGRLKRMRPGSMIRRPPAMSDSWTPSSSDCEESPCYRVTNLINAGGYLHRKEYLPNLERIREMGVQEWVKDEEERWRCPKCRLPMSWYDTKCARCGEPRSGRLFPLPRDTPLPY
jgi:hypothetical protein